jgi:hypothetical protein
VQVIFKSEGAWGQFLATSFAPRYEITYPGK